MEWCAQVLKKGSKETSESLGREVPPSRGEGAAGSRRTNDFIPQSIFFSKSVDSSGFSIVVGICITKRIFLCLRFTHGEHGRYHADHEYGLSVPATGFLFEEVRERICLL